MEGSHQLARVLQVFIHTIQTTTVAGVLFVSNILRVQYVNHVLSLNPTM